MTNPHLTISKPRNIAGARDPGAKLDDVYGHDMTDTVDMGISDGTKVVASCTAKLFS